MWNTKTIEGMEQTAKEEQMQDCSVKVNGTWLCVTVSADSITYQYGKNFVSRNQAIEILKLRVIK